MTALLCLLSLLAAEDGPAIRLHGVIDGKSKPTIDVSGIDRATLANLAKAKMEPADWHALLSVRVSVDKAKDNAPPLLGTYRVEDGVLRFEPRFPLVRGVRYRATFDPARLPGAESGKAVVAEFHQPKPVVKPTTVVEHVYPTRNTLPENQLKFYLHFTAAMSKGEAYRHIHLLDAKGKEVEMPFLELDEELWSPDGKRFTLFFDPGRIKRGLKPREEVGPALEEGKSYTLVIDRDWSDAEGNPLRATFRKAFTVGPPDDEAIDPKKWKFRRPLAEGPQTREPLKVFFPKPLDHALLQRMLWVVDAHGKKVDGRIVVSEEETCWEFHHSGAWREAGYYLVINTALEDLAGNNVGRPFEVDVFRPVQRELKTETVKLPFLITGSGKLEKP
jgi:hypothetical protein